MSAIPLREKVARRRQAALTDFRAWALKRLPADAAELAISLAESIAENDGPLDQLRLLCKYIQPATADRPALSDQPHHDTEKRT
ncbi:MAG: hypothetical protein NDJ92_18340 [Thermoanaerobaculia bacterium]|nr:hypothetical protein [Thermoanaerobaculia bacterium]